MQGVSFVPHDAGAVVQVDTGTDLSGHDSDTRPQAQSGSNGRLESPGNLHLGAVFRSEAAQELPVVGSALFATSDPASLRDVVDIEKRLRLTAEELASR